MSFLKRLFNQQKYEDSKAGLPSDWRQTLRQCNYFMARREIAEMFRVMSQSAQAEGQQAFYAREIADCWNRFADNPCYEAAESLLLVMPPVYRYFLGCCPGGELHKVALRTATSFSLGGCSLESRPRDISILKELTSQEYMIFPRQFNGEVIYHAQAFDFLGRQWQLMISVVKEKLYKWAASLELEIDEDGKEWRHDVFQYCERFLGSPTQENQGVFLWDTPDGNVILQFTQTDELDDISIFATSREIRKLERL